MSPFDTLEEQLLATPATEVVQAINDAAGELRAGLAPDAWRRAAEELRTHPIHAHLLEDPYTHRAFTKPRGYAGDAVMLDFCYFGTSPHFKHDPSISPVGRAVFDWTAGGGAGEAVRNRRRLLADAVDEVAKARENPTITSVACGMVREANLSQALAEGRVGRWVCLDQDVESLRALDAETERNETIETVACSVRSILKGSSRLPTSDLVYAAGLLDYLRDEVASALVARLLGATRTGGRVIVGNFAPDTAERPYLEAFMDWWLLYRDEGELRGLTAGLPNDQMASIDVYRDPTGRTIYLDIRKA